MAKTYWTTMSVKVKVALSEEALKQAIIPKECEDLALRNCFRNNTRKIKSAKIVGKPVEFNANKFMGRDDV